jgi:hypothetical protein
VPDEPEPPVEPDPFECLCFLRGVVSVPPGVGAVTVGWNVCTGSLLLELPPLDAIATTTIRKSAAHPSATSLRRR